MIVFTVEFCEGCLEFNGEQDHIHLLIHYPPKIAISVLVNNLKGVSSRLLRKKHATHLDKYLWDGHLWSPSYFTASCGGAPLTIVKQYIQNQQTPTN